ncbi:hypothetical protein V9L20_13705 [Variovorax sp. CCNWLW225]|jgi:hypothetical protein|uniref:hypothetical protein n=1 Tax=Variovorax sp. CCNWLW225 TaxID=3127462 RepID=UPI003078410A
MQRDLGLCGLLLFGVILTGCGGGTGNASGDSGPDGAAARLFAAGESSSLPRTDFAAPAGEHATTGTKELGSVIRPLARSPFAFARNGQFHVYAGNGSRKRLALDFDTRTYTVADNSGQGTSGTFSEDATEPGTYIFASTRITSVVNTARFRITADAIVGAFPFEKPWSDPVRYEVVPFIGARAFVTNPAELDGSYNRFGISRNSDGSSDSQILAMEISGNGTLLEMCFDIGIYRIATCPYQSRRSYLLTASVDSVWTGTNIAAPNDVLQFRMARIGGENVWLSGGYTDAAPGIHVFRVGLKDATIWPTARYGGGSSDGRWGTNIIGPTSSSRTSFDATGTPSTLVRTVSTLGESAPLGIRGVDLNGTQKYFAIQNGALSVVLGARNPDTQGYIQVGLFKDHAGVDTRSGTYHVFSGQRSIVKLTLDFDAGTYRMNEDFSQASSGTFSADPSDPGSYIFDSQRITGAVNTARFRVAQDAIIGAFPFYVHALPPNQYQIQPFVAARNFVTYRGELEGLYDLMVAGIPVGANAYPLNLMRMAIPASGSSAQLCKLVPVTSCADGSSSPFSVITGVTPESWLLSAPAWVTRLYVARVGTRRLALYATTQMYDNPTRVGGYMVMGLRRPSTGSANWTSLSGRSYSGSGDLGAMLVDTSSYTTTYARSDGTTALFSLALSPVTNNTQVKIGADTIGTPYAVIQDDLFMFAMPTSGDASQLHISLAN